MKKFLVLMIAILLVAGGAGVALTKGTTVSGKVTSVKGDIVTIEVDKGNASQISEGDTVEIEVKEEKKAAAPKKGMDMLMGC